MFNQTKLLAVLAGTLAALVAMTAPAAAQAPSLAGKTVTMTIGSGTGGANDLGAAWSRVTLASTFPAIRPSSRRTCRAPVA